MTDLTKLTAEELKKIFQDRIIVGLRNPEWHEICRRLERLEKCEVALQKYKVCAHGYDDCLCTDAARAALEE